MTVLAPGAVLPDTDPELRDVVLHRLREEGIVFRENAKPTSVNARGAGVALQVHEAEAEAEETINASHLLLLGARIPALDDIDLDKAGVRRDKKRPDHLQLGRNFKTTNGKVHAIGEAAGTHRYTRPCNKRSSSSATPSSATPHRPTPCSPPWATPTLSSPRSE